MADLTPKEIFDQHVADPEWHMTVEDLVGLGRPGFREFINLLLDCISENYTEYTVVDFIVALYEPYFKEREEKEEARG